MRPFKALCKWFKYSANKREPRMDPCETSEATLLVE